MGLGDALLRELCHSGQHGDDDAHSQPAGHWLRPETYQGPFKDRVLARAPSLQPARPSAAGRHSSAAPALGAAPSIPSLVRWSAPPAACAPEGKRRPRPGARDGGGGVAGLAGPHDHDHDARDGACLPAAPAPARGPAAAVAAAADDDDDDAAAAAAVDDGGAATHARQRGVNSRIG
eukprot:scaffold303_cov410-Prasinococcus_capsulatus_cf.AAC.6